MLSYLRPTGTLVASPERVLLGASRDLELVFDGRLQVRYSRK